MQNEIICSAHKGSEYGSEMSCAKGPPMFNNHPAIHSKAAPTSRRVSVYLPVTNSLCGDFLL